MEEFSTVSNNSSWDGWINRTGLSGEDEEYFYMMTSNWTKDASSSPLPTVQQLMYCGDGLKKFRQNYLLFHGYISLMVCIFGTLANTLNIIVLTQMDQRISPTNAILTGLALADNFVSIEYIPFACHMYILGKRPVYEKFSYPWSVYVLIHAHAAQVFHTISIWLTLLLAVWRYISVAHALKARDWCTLERAMQAILVAYLGSAVVCIPLYLTYAIKDTAWRPVMSGNSSFGMPDSPDGPFEKTIYVLGTSEMAKANNGLLQSVNFWTFSVVVKLIPCLALTILSFQLIRALMNAKKRKENLKAHNSSSLSKKATCSTRRGSSATTTVDRAGGQPSSGGDRTTRMLLAVLFLFLLTEFPQGILALLSGILGDAFFSNCYDQLGELMDILALFNSAVNIFFYYFMNRQFRQTFNRLFRPRILDKWKAVPAVTVEPTQLNNVAPMSSTSAVAINIVPEGAAASPHSNLLRHQPQEVSHRIVNKTNSAAPEPVVV